MPQTIVVVGATGKQGSYVVDRLLARGDKYAVVAVVRNTESAAAAKLKSKGVKLVKGDMLDEASLVAAFTGADGVYLVTILEPFNEVGVKKEIQSANVMVAAAVAAKVPYVVCSSVASCDRNTGIPHFDSKALFEARLKASGIPFFSVRPVAFMENIELPGSSVEEGFVPGLVNPDIKLDLVACEDIAEVVALGFDDPAKYKNTVLEIAGDSLTGPEMSEIMTKVRGNVTKFKYSQAPMGILKFVMPELYIMGKWFNEVGYHVDIENVKKTHPKVMNFESWLIKNGYATKKLPDNRNTYTLLKVFSLAAVAGLGYYVYSKYS
jgi:uncharacterized protein YbjT (DUF2867 family)